eukprot:189300-Pelagomonas_calceolata.AAC.2
MKIVGVGSWGSLLPLLPLHLKPHSSSGSSCRLRIKPTYKAVSHGSSLLAFKVCTPLYGQAAGHGIESN